MKSARVLRHCGLGRHRGVAVASPESRSGALRRCGFGSHPEAAVVSPDTLTVFARGLFLDDADGQPVQLRTWMQCSDIALALALAHGAGYSIL